MQTLRAGKSSDSGFTLLELIVVITLLSLILFFTVPRFQTAVFSDPAQKAYRQLIYQIKSLKEKAVEEQTTLILNFDVDNGKIWVTTETMDEDQMTDQMEKATVLPEDIRLMDIVTPGKGMISSGTAQIRFYAKGYSDKALIHIEGEDGQMTLLVEPFLSRVKIDENYKEFEDY